jgi:lysophospholipase L1-like esterase
MRILIFGDSITQGFWDKTGGWVDRLRTHYDILKDGDVTRGEPTVFNLGISGDTSLNVLKRVEQETLARTWDNQKPIVLVQIGTNDARLQNGEPQTNTSQYKDNLKQIADRLRSITVRTIFVGLTCCNESKTSPVHWEQSYWDNVTLKSYEVVMRDLAKELNLQFIPIFDDFKQEFESDSSILPDGLHPNQKGHQIIFDTVLSYLEQNELL